MQILLFSLFITNPLYLYLGNCILSDALFIPLSICWFTLLIWIINSPNNKLLYLQGVLLFLAFIVRYNALYYPFVGAVAIIISRRKWTIKVSSILFSGVLIYSFITFTSFKYKQMTGEQIFSPFSGWQLANNALYAYRYVDSANHKVVPMKFKELDGFVRHYYDTASKNLKDNPQELLQASTVYMWDPSSPLQRYMKMKYKRDTVHRTLKRWATIAPLYEEYGKWLILHYPMQFARYYLIPNALKYYTPPVEFLQSYNMGIDSVNDIALIWFKYRSNKVNIDVKDYNVTILEYQPILCGVMNVLFISGVGMYLFLFGFKRNAALDQLIIISLLLWVINFLFSVFASPVALRFQVFPTLIAIIINGIIIEKISKAAFITSSTVLKMSIA
jgi:hypothetical protein